MKHVKDQSPDCGGPSDIVLHGQDGSITAFWPTWPSYKTVEKIESWAGLIDMNFGQLIQAAATRDSNAIDMALRTLNANVRQMPHGKPEDLWTSGQGTSNTGPADNATGRAGP